MDTLIFKIIEHGSEDYKKAVSLREEALWKPLGLAFKADELANILAKEKDHIQIAGYLDSKIVATAALVAEGDICKMQRVAVDSNVQNSGIGSKMMKFCEEQALILGFKEIYCHARDAAVNFYLRNNYIPEGKYFIEDSIPHLTLRKAIRH